MNIFLLPAEIANLYAREGQAPPVSVKTGFWIFLPFLGWIVWVVKVQGALNRFWVAHGATAIGRMGLAELDSRGMGLLHRPGFSGSLPTGPVSKRVAGVLG